ncbi:MAG: electron transfer flavoprotein subunit alpha/FixB family protein [Bacteroidia bacterium]|nr:electron transfer flavoprotein subunit alpha/FixB family protein [Bacteroidia bacterium]
MVLVFAESPKGKFEKPAFEAVTYGKKVSEMVGGECVAIAIGDAKGAEDLGIYGATRVLQVNDPSLAHLDSQMYASIIAQAADSVGAKVVIVGFTATGKSIEGRLAVKLSAGSVSGASYLPTVNGGFKVKKSVFSSKAIAEYEVTTEKKVISLVGNSIQPEASGSAVTVESFDAEIPARRITVKDVDTIKGVVPLPEAELVVSAGRGMKSPENWNIIEELATVLGATTACSRPVSDTGWRPHHEHVGQTGVAIRPNLYIAAGISGAIQHLAGVNNSKVIVVINKDPEAPFFKAANYGICADLFDVVPRLTEAVKKFKQN